MFFSKVAGTFLETCPTVNITMQKSEDGKITLLIVPKLKDDSKAKLQPITLTGTPQQLDEGFPTAWAKVEEASGIITNIDTFITTAKEEEKKLKKGASKTEEKKDDKAEVKTSKDDKAATKGNKQKSEEVKKEEKPSPFAANLFDDPTASGAPETTNVETTTDVVETPDVVEEIKEEPKQEPLIEPKPEPVKETTTSSASVDEDEIF